MAKLILISGSINSGKSTTSKRLVELLPKAAHLQGDALRHFVSWLPLAKAVPITLQNIISVSKNFLAAGFDVVVDYPLDKDEFEEICNGLNATADAIYPFILSLRLEVAQSQRGDRVLAQREIDKIAIHYSERLHNPGFGVCIDNSDLTAEEAVQTMLGYIASHSL